MQAVSGGLASSRLGVKATEKLDNGMMAVAVLEYGLDTETNQTTTVAVGNPTTGTTSATNLSARQQMLALAGDFGTVATGYLQTAGYDFGSKYDVVSGSSVTPLGNITAAKGFMVGSSAGAKRAQRALAYISPNMSGLVVAVNYVTALAGLGNTGLASGTADTQTNVAVVSADYAKDAFSVGAVYLGTNTGAASGGGAANVTEYALGVGYNFGSVALKATFQDQVTNVTNASHNSATSVGATLPVGPGTVALSYALSTMAAANTNASGFTVAYLQGLSKTTTAYVAYNAMAQDAASANVSVYNNGLTTNLAAGGSSSVIAAGLSKKF
jgi:predicted porin